MFEINHNVSLIFSNKFARTKNSRLLPPSHHGVSETLTTSLTLREYCNKSIGNIINISRNNFLIRSYKSMLFLFYKHRLFSKGNILSIGTFIFNIRKEIISFEQRNGNRSSDEKNPIKNILWRFKLFFLYLKNLYICFEFIRISFINK